MKNVLLTAFVMLTMSAFAKAELLNIPRGGPQALATADYGGFHYSTWTINTLASAASTHYSTVTTPGNNGVPAAANQTNGISGVFLGMQYSSGTTADFTDVYDSTSADAGIQRGPIARVYNVGSSTGGVGAFASGFSGPIKPIRFSRGLIFRPSRADFNSLNALFYTFE